MASSALALIVLPALVVAAVVARWRGRSPVPRLVWGSVPVINNSYWSRAIREDGFPSETFMMSVYFINEREDWDRVLDEEWTWCPRALKTYLAFGQSLVHYDIFFISFAGFFIGQSPIARLQHLLFRLARKKVVVLPYGADAYVYRRIRSTALAHALLTSYPKLATEQRRIAADVDYWVRWADCVISGYMGPDGFGRWDVLIPSPSFLDLDAWERRRGYSAADGTAAEVVVVHAPNHRGFKGTEFVLSAIDRLKNEGIKIRLVLLERVKNSEVRRILLEEADILVEQLVFHGHGMNGVEGMAAGLPTISNLDNDEYILPLRRWSYFNECPLVSATPETVYGTLRRLVTDPVLRQEIGEAARAYAVKYHGLDSSRYLFRHVVDYVTGQRDTIMNLYHPLLGEYPRRSAAVVSPLVRGRVPQLAQGDCRWQESP